MTETLIRTEEPLEPDYHPETLVDRSDEVSAIESVLPTDSEAPSQNIHMQGPHGSGKSAVVHQSLAALPDHSQRFVVPCREFDTQYKVLRALHAEVTGEPTNTGYHTAEFQRTIEERLGTVPTVIVLDDVDFLLENDGGELLYFLSRLEDSDSVSLVLLSSHTTDLKATLEDRTYSSLYPQRLRLDPYESEDIYGILRNRAEQALAARSIHRNALTFIAATTSNAALGLEWLRQAAVTAESVITEQTVQSCKERAYERYVEAKLSNFTDHHRQLYQGIETLAADGTVTSGSVYEAYRSACAASSLDALSNRRISDFITHLELLGLIAVTYHYGGRNGRTRDIRLRRPLSQVD